jgi:NAD(P)-dependent dehydrogenase (short-subunit alcohol dehydrogenase family)
MLHDVNAIIYGAGGSLGGAVARALAKAGDHWWDRGRDMRHDDRTELQGFADCVSGGVMGHLPT